LPDGAGRDFVTLTGCGQEQDIRRTQVAGFAAHLIKQIDYALLQMVVAQIQLSAS
jgi:hypothetical protein